MRKKFLISLLALAASSLFSAAAEEGADRLKWFQDAKFGVFIHFGARETAGEGATRGERNDAAVHAFNPVDFDASEWLDIIEQSGAKYLVFTTKHHDGFCKWDSALTDWDITEQTDFKRDMVAELADASKEAGVKLGFYYSIADWHHPEYDPYYSNRNGFHYSPNPDANISKYMKYMYGQIEELCVKYDPSLFWFDGSSGFRPQERKRILGQQEMVDLLHSHGAISNSRLGDDDSLRYVDYLSMGDNQSPFGNIGVPFESAGTMNDSWHHRPNDRHYKSVSELLRRLVTIVGNGGNYLLNIGPDDQGVIPEPDATRLKAMGAWLEKNGEAIYGTSASPHPHGFSWGSITQREKGENTLLYLNVVDWPADGEFELYGLDNRILKASLLDGGKELAHSSSFDPAATLTKHNISIPEEAPDPNVSVIVLEIEGVPSMEQMHLQQQDGAVHLWAYKAKIHDHEFIPGKLKRAVDYKMFTVPLKVEGISPERMLSVSGLTNEGDSISWDLKMVTPGDYDIEVLTLGKKSPATMKAYIAGQTVENTLKEHSSEKTIELSTHLHESHATLGRISIASPGIYSLTLEVASNPGEKGPRIRSVRLLPVKDAQ